MNGTENSTAISNMNISKPVEIVGNRWYYSDNVYINICAGYYELFGPSGYIRSFINLEHAVNAAVFQVRFSH